MSFQYLEESKLEKLQKEKQENFDCKYLGSSLFLYHLVFVFLFVLMLSISSFDHF